VSSRQAFDLGPPAPTRSSEVGAVTRAKQNLAREGRTLAMKDDDDTRVDEEFIASGLGLTKSELRVTRAVVVDRISVPVAGDGRGAGDEREGDYRQQ